jgi:hypothetical protein
MSLLASAAYDPAVAVTQSTSALLAMTALDTTNLRVTFTAPANGTVFVRLKGQTHGATTFPRLLLGVLDGATVRGRGTPMGTVWAALATQQVAQETGFLVTGLTPGNSYTWDAAYGVEVLNASSGLKYGGPDNATTNDAFGSFQFEVWSTANLLTGVFYDPAAAVTQSMTSLLAMTAMDTTNLRLTFTAPASGAVMWRLHAQSHGNQSSGQALLGILEGATVVARTPGVLAGAETTLVTTALGLEATGVITGLSAGSHTFDAAYGVEVVAGAGGGIKYGGPDDATADNAFGGIAFEIWAA